MSNHDNEQKLQELHNRLGHLRAGQANTPADETYDPSAIQLRDEAFEAEIDDVKARIEKLRPTQ